MIRPHRIYFCWHPLLDGARSNGAGVRCCVMRVRVGGVSQIGCSRRDLSFRRRRWMQTISIFIFFFYFLSCAVARLRLQGRHLVDRHHCDGVGLRPGTLLQLSAHEGLIHCGRVCRAFAVVVSIAPSLWSCLSRLCSRFPSSERADCVP